MKFKRRISKYRSSISSSECQKYRNDSLAIQPNNKPIQNCSISDVIDRGIEMMKQDGFVLVEGLSDV